VRQLIEEVFDLEAMNKCLADNLIDLEKLPLGILTFEKI